jgi:hypothetical protein
MIVMRILSVVAYNERVLSDGFLVSIFEVCAKFEDYLTVSFLKLCSARPTFIRITAAK